MYAPNLLITNYCNQSCPFCFASREMNSTTLDREMKMSDYKKIIAKVTKGGLSKSVKLLGGEPTLHSKLFEMLDIAMGKKLSVQIFTNGVMGRERVERLSSYGKRIGYTFNVMTPGFQMNEKLRNEVTSNMVLLGKKSKMTLSITIDPFFNHNQFFTIASPVLPITNNIRIGFANPIAHTKNWYTFSDFPKMGGILEQFMRTARDKGFVGTFTPNCGFTRCMFTSEQFDYFKSQTTFVGWSCFGKESSMDVAVDMSAFHCFPLSEHKRVDLTQISYREAHKRLIKERMALWSTVKKDICLTCPFYGYGRDKCPGPCLAFTMNESSVY